MVPRSNLAEVDEPDTVEGSTCELCVGGVHDVLKSLAIISNFWVRATFNLSSKALKSMFPREVGVVGGRIISGSLWRWQAPVGHWPICVIKSGECSSLPGRRFPKGEGTGGPAWIDGHVVDVGGVGGKDIGLFSSTVVDGF